MIIGQLRGLGAARIDHDERAIGIRGDFAQRRTCTLEAVRLPWILADENRDLGMLELGRGTPSGEAAFDPELAGFFLRERIGGIDGAERAARRGAVGAAQMIALPAAAIIENARATEFIAHAHQARGDLGDGGIPINFFEAAISAASHRRVETVLAALLIVDAL